MNSRLGKRCDRFGTPASSGKRLAVRVVRNRLLTGLLLGPAVGLSGGVSAGPENGVGQAEQLSATHLYLALHLQHYTGVCGDAYAAAGARTPSSLCLDHAVVPLPGPRPDRFGQAR